MKKTSLIAFLLFAYNCFAQVCRPGITELNVKYGEYTNLLRTGGDMFWDGSNSKFTIGNSANSPSALLFAGGAWLGGKTSTGEVRMAGVTYRSLNDNYDFFPGPLDQFGETKENDCKNWDKIFSIEENDLKTAIELIYHGSENPTSGDCDQLPLSVKTWPAKGNPYFKQYYGFDLPIQDLASFFDYDLDGLYDPCKGDMPSLTSQNCDYNSVYEVLASFPSQLHFNIFNDNGGVHRLTAGNALKMEVHSYFYTFDDKDGEDMSFYKFKTLYKGNEPLDSFYFSIWLDPDLGCYQDDYLGTSSKEDMVFAYNADNIDGSNGASCAGGNSTFGDKIPMVGVSYIQGLIDADGKNTGLTSSYITDNCGIGAPDFPCDPLDRDSSFYLAMKGTKYSFDGNPTNLLDNTMCSNGIGIGDRRILMNTGGIKLLPGDTKEVIIGVTVAKNVPHPCPDSKYIIEVNKKAKQLYTTCWQTFEGPDAPKVETVGLDRTITLKFDNNTIGHNNKDLAYEETIPQAMNVNDNKYKFEGYKVYQVNERDYDLNKLGDSNSLLIFTFDLKNEVDSVFNWETIIEDNSQRKLVKNLKALGQNNGVPNSIDIDFDYINQTPMKVKKTYHYVVIAYGYNNYAAYNPATNTGQARQYISSLNNARVITITPKYVNNEYIATIKRISGRGNYNDIEISTDTREKMLSNDFDDTINYLPGKGPFDIKIIDTTKIKGKTLRIEVEGPVDGNSKVCGFVDDKTYYTITDLSSGESYKSMLPIYGSYDETFDDLGIAISIFQPTESSPEDIDDNGYIGEKMEYLDNSKEKWFGALRDKASTYNYLENVLDPIVINSFRNQAIILSTSKLSSGNFFPFFYSRYLPDNFSLPYITATSSELMPLMLDATSGLLKLKDLNNIDIVFTPDKSKWSRCMVVETASSYYQNIGGPSTKFFEVKANKSVDKDGNEEAQSTGFSWFPGYAVDVETGQRLNVFFGENTALSKNTKSLKNPSIADDMLFNPSDEMITESKFETLDSFILNYPVGGGHYIYVTKQVYDECAQLALRLKSGTSSFVKRDPLSAITWAAIPVLAKGSKMLSYAEGAIPNGLTLSMRVNNLFFSKTNNIDIAKFKTCDHDGKNPVYEISFDKKSNSVVNVPRPRWSFKSSFSGFTVDAVEEEISIELADLKGNRISISTLKPGQELVWNAANKGLNNTMVLVKIISIKTGLVKGYKSVVIW